MGLLSRHKLPSAARPALVRDERVLAWAPSGEAAVVVTNLGVWLPGRERLGWHQIHKATWSGGQLTVTPSVLVRPAGRYDVMADDEPVRAMLDEPGDVPAEVRDRVNRSVAYTAHFPLPGGGVRVVARRSPGVDGVAWHVRYDEGTDPADPEVLTATDDLVAAAAAPDPD
jgi:hypothetical protein